MLLTALAAVTQCLNIWLVCTCRADGEQLFVPHYVVCLFCQVLKSIETKKKAPQVAKKDKFVGKGGMATVRHV